MTARRRLLLVHRYLGLAAAVFVLLLALSGIALNHTEALGLDQRHVANRTMLAWYGIAPAGVEEAYRVGDHWVARIGERVYLDQREIHRGVESLGGAVALPEAIAVAADAALLLLTSDGELIERMEEVHGLPAGLRRLGVHNGQVAVQTADDAFMADESLLLWTPIAAGAVNWPESVSLPVSLEERLVAMQRGKGLTLERVLLDVHSGRFLGRYGVLVMDLAAVALLVLVAIGIWLWAFRARRARPG